MKMIFTLAVALFGSALASTLTRGSSCDYETPCPEPLSCGGPSDRMRCLEKKALGKRCGQDPYWVCEDGLLCDDGTCKKVVEKPGRCDEPNTICAEGLSCVGEGETKRCNVKRELGMECGQDPFWVCEDGLVCDDGICKRLVEKRRRCDEPYTVCAEGLFCLGNRRKRCAMKKMLGMECRRDPFWVCEDGLVCYDGTCKKVVKRGRCDVPDTVCAEGLSCLGNRKKRCVMKKRMGMACRRDPFWVCEDGLVCNDGTCKKVIEKPGRCDIPDTICAEGFSCVGNGEIKRCNIKIGRGMKCGQDPFWVCEDGLECVDNVCA